MRVKLFLPSLIIAFVLNACVSMQVNPVSGNKRAYGYSWEEEIQMGAEADKEIAAQFGIYEDEALTEYVNNIGKELVEVSHLRREGIDEKFQNTPFTFRVLNTTVVNAFALPGGYVYVTRGLLAHLNNEAQLAVVLGHEIGHVAARHASKRAAEQQFGQLAILGGAILGESFGLDGTNILELSSQTAQLLFLKYSRDDERESDQLGVEYSSMKNYEAAEGAKFFTSLKRISEEEGGEIPTLLSTHPDPGEREQTIPELAQYWAEKGYEQSIVDQEEFMNRLNGIMVGENPREGFVENGIFYHPDLAFQFAVPQGFYIQNQPTAVVLYNEDQNAIIQFGIDSESETPQASVRIFTSQQGIQVLNQSQLNVNGLNAYAAEATAQMEDGTELQILNTAISYNGNIYNFLCYTLPDLYGNYEQMFSSVIESFDRVTDQRILNAQPARLQIRQVEQTAVFSELIPNQLPVGLQAIDLAIMNQVNLDETIEAGTLIKIPVQ